jgi:3-oxoacyl-[acyl-carrier protein] reductase
MDLNARSIIVTGGARGLGRAIVEELLRENSRVIIIDKDETPLDEFPAYQNVSFFKCELTDFESVKTVFDVIIEENPQIHGLVNNAGVLHSEPLISLKAKDRIHSLDNWQKVLDINLTVPFVLTGYVAEHMVLNRIKGVIINISSISACGNVGQTAYAASKAGLEAMTKVWAKELGPLGIRAVAVAPGFIQTSSTDHVMPLHALNELKKKTPLRTLGSAQQVAECVKFALRNDFISGTVIELNGGLTI